MERVIGELLGRAIGGLAVNVIVGALTQNSSTNSTSKLRHQTRTLGPPPSQHGRAVLISSSTITFGNDCERLVNIAFQTSQTFPTMMSTYADVIEYLRKELAKHYPDEYFHIIIGENHQFGFSVDDSQYFAEIEQNRYRLLIFTTARNSKTKPDTHDADSQMKLKWN